VKLLLNLTFTPDSTAMQLRKWVKTQRLLGFISDQTFYSESFDKTAKLIKNLGVIISDGVLMARS
jgi:hypothetical protein